MTPEQQAAWREEVARAIPLDEYQANLTAADYAALSRLFDEIDASCARASLNSRPAAPQQEAS